LFFKYLEIIGSEVVGTGQVFAEILINIVKIRDGKSYKAFLKARATEFLNAGESLTLFDNIAVLTDNTGVLSPDELDGQEAISLGGKVLDLGEFDGEGIELEFDDRVEIFNKMCVLKDRKSFEDFTKYAQDKPQNVSLFSNPDRYQLRVTPS